MGGVQKIFYFHVPSWMAMFLAASVCGIARMTSDNVKAAAKRYLDPKQYFQPILLPARAAPPAARLAPSAIATCRPDSARFRR